ncbi:unnamed protein product [Parajaminaea phylloscopi]
MAAMAGEEETPPLATPTRSALTKPRLLYRGPLQLPDGTLLPGVAFVSTVSPFGPSPSASNDYDADICLALEMMRNRGPLAIEQLDLQAKSSAPPPSKPVRLNKGMATGPEGLLKTGVQQRRLEASGHIRMYVDPREVHTASFFERAFCWHDDWDSDPTKDTSRQAFTISLTSAARNVAHPNDVQSQDSGMLTRDPLTSSYSSTFGGNNPAAASGRKGASLDLVLFARLGDAGENLEPDRVVEVVVGRSVMERRKILGDTGSLQGPRPDDPLPRTLKIINAGAVVSSSSRKDQTGAKIPIKNLNWRKSRSEPRVPTEKTNGGNEAADRSVSQLQRPGDRPAGAIENAGRPSHRDSPPSAKDRLGVAFGGNHTPGRRGEKLRSKSSSESRAHPESPSAKRRKTSAASADIFTGETSDLPLRAGRPPAVSPEQTALDLQTPALIDSSTPNENSDPGLGRSQERRIRTHPDPAQDERTHRNADSTDASLKSTVEIRNRGIIKKLVQYQLLGRGLTREDEEYDRCFHAAYNGTVVAMKRHQLCDAAIDRVRAAQFVACHLNMYLPAPAEAMAAMMFGTPAITMTPPSANASTVARTLRHEAVPRAPTRSSSFAEPESQGEEPADTSLAIDDDEDHETQALLDSCL